jgi:hypothetical protein
MNRNQPFFRGISLLLVVVFILVSTSCGTILYPERRGQPAGRIDAGVAVLDGIGLLLFFIPGVIAFAVDFATGAIYLPPDSSRRHVTPSDLQNARVAQIDPASLTRSKIESLVEQQIGQDVELTSSDIRVAKVVSGRDLIWGEIPEVLTPSQLAAFEDN